LKVHLHHFQRQKVQKKSQDSRNQGFSYFFCVMIVGSGSISLTSGSDPDPGGPKTCGSGGSGSIFGSGSGTLQVLLSNYMFTLQSLQETPFVFAPRGILILWLVSHNLCISYSFPCLIEPCILFCVGFDACWLLNLINRGV
jgi:hypothetical protein